MKEYLATFYTHSGALKYSRCLRQNRIAAETMPVPRKLSSNCGICVKFLLDADTTPFISEDIEKIFEIKQNETTLVYHNLE